MRLLAGGCCCLLAALLMLQAWVAAAEKEPVKILHAYCASCHGLDKVRNAVPGKDKASWLQTIARMQQKGARISDADEDVLAAYLAEAETPEF